MHINTLLCIFHIVLEQCAANPKLFCYNGGCPSIGHDTEVQCICSEPYTGPDCSQVMCSHSAVTCYNGGECIDGKSCTCPPGYGGVDCRGRKNIKILDLIKYMIFLYSSLWSRILL